MKLKDSRIKSKTKLSVRDKPLSRESFAQAALAYVDEHGYENLSMRTLGQYMGVHATAVYRHFRSKNELVEAVLAFMFQNHGVDIPSEGSPKDKILGLLKSLRRVFSLHPNLALPNLVLQDEQATAELVRAVLVLLEEMGLKGKSLMIAYQMLETFSVGSNAYDWGGYPEGLEARRRGRRLVGHPSAERISRSLASMKKLNDEAFEIAASALLDACEKMADKQDN